MVKREKLGHRLKRVRIARDLSLRETANKVGVSPTYLSRVENCLDPSPPTEKTLRALHLAGRVRFTGTTGSTFIAWPVERASQEAGAL